MGKNPNKKRKAKNDYDQIMNGPFTVKDAEKVFNEIAEETKVEVPVKDLIKSSKTPNFTPKPEVLKDNQKNLNPPTTFPTKGFGLKETWGPANRKK